MSHWHELFVPYDKEVIELLGDRPKPELWLRQFDTGSESTKWRNFIYNPIRELAKDDGPLKERGSETTAEGESVSEWRVATLIVNHHKPLNPRIGLASALVDRDKREVGITIYKLEEA